MRTLFLTLLTPALAFEFSFPRANDTVDLASSVTLTWDSKPEDSPVVDLIWHGDFEGGIGTWDTPVGENISVEAQRYEFDPQIVLDYLENSEPVIYEGRVHRVEVQFRTENGSSPTSSKDSIWSDKFAIEGYENEGNGPRPFWGTLGLVVTVAWFLG